MKSQIRCHCRESLTVQSSAKDLAIIDFSMLPPVFNRRKHREIPTVIVILHTVSMMNMATLR
jgi:hypothetical protein